VPLPNAPSQRLVQVFSCMEGQLSPPVLEQREALRACPDLASLLGMLRRTHRLDDALAAELWAVDAEGRCMLVGCSVPPADVLDAAALLLHVLL
jgi:hypothetical protein